MGVFTIAHKFCENLSKAPRAIDSKKYIQNPQSLDKREKAGFSSN